MHFIFYFHLFDKNYIPGVPKSYNLVIVSLLVNVDL